jgi:hypothetical protein
LPSSSEMAKVSSSSSMSSNVLSFRDHLAGRRVSLALISHGNLLSPAQLRARIKRPLELIKSEARFFAQRSPRFKLRRQQALPPLASTFAKYRPCWRVRLMFRCVAIVCQRLATAPADMHMTYSIWGWAEEVMDRVTRCRVKKVQVRLQRRACCAVVRSAARASACVFDVCCSKRWMVFRSFFLHHSSCIKRAAAFILVCRLLLPPALQADPTF